MTEGTSPRVLLVVPTLGRRPAYLRQTLASIRAQSIRSDLVVVCPPATSEAREIAAEFGARLLDDPGSLSGAVNLGLREFGGPYEFANWLGDDDLLTPGSLAATSSALDRNPGAVASFGFCEYVSGEGVPLWISRAGGLAPWLMTWGPDLVPQPGMLFRRAAFDAVGGLDESLKFAMDLDLLLKLRRIGRLVNTGRVVSQFRWHADSLTVGDRTSSQAEADMVKLRYLGAVGKGLAPLWRPVVAAASRRAAANVSARARRSG